MISSSSHQICPMRLQAESTNAIVSNESALVMMRPKAPSGTAGCASAIVVFVSSELREEKRTYKCPPVTM
jgi:hypothetical protein